MSSATADPSRRALDAALLAWMGEERWASPERDEQRFTELALDLFAFQFAHSEPYRRFCEARGATPASVPGWREIPPVPTGAFKELALRCFPSECEVATFRTSGTSGSRRGELHLDTLALYEASLLSTMRRYVFPDLGPGERMRILVLAPPASEARDSSLSHMFSHAALHLGSADSAFLVSGGELHDEAARDALAAAREPLALCGTAFAFVHLLESLVDDVALPKGSRVMETGGFKGRSREIARGELHAWIEARLGVPASHIVNQYGMTELGSQFYDSVLAEPEAARRKLGPPWARVRLVDPLTGDEASPGQPGVVTVHDLANTGTIAAVATADLGVAVEAACGSPGFDVLGREEGAEERGCSIAADLMLGE